MNERANEREWPGGRVRRRETLDNQNGRDEGYLHFIKPLLTKHPVGEFSVQQWAARYGFSSEFYST